MKAALPPNESDRLQALRQYDVLDTAPEQEFDDLTRLAAQICGTPISAITLLDENRQWFKSRVGLEATETPRDLSFCSHTILGDEILLIPDATKDERFADNPSVTGDPHIRFYVGVPLLTPEGHAIGALCVMDTVPHQINQAQQDALHRLGRQAVALFEARPDMITEQKQSRKARHEAERERRFLAAEAARRDAENLKASEERFRRLFESAQDGILILDAATGKIEEVNPFLCLLLGYEPNEFLGKRLWEIGTFRDIVANQNALRSLQEKGFIRYDDLPLETKSGQAISVEFVSNVYASGDQNVIQCNIRDISERKEAEAKLRQSKANLAKAQQIAHLGSWVWSLHTMENIETNALSWSDEVFRIFGYQPGAVEVSYELFMNAVHPGDRIAIEAMIHRALETGQNVNIEHRILRPDGTERIVHEQSDIIYDENGKPVQVVGTVQDITERKRAEAALRASEECFQSIVANVPGMVYQLVQHPDGSFEWTFVSEGCREVYGTEPETFKNDPAWPLNHIHPDDRAEFNRSFAASAEALSPWSWEGRHRLDSGRTIWVRAAARPHRLPDGSTRWDGLVVDITARKAAEEQRDRFFTMSLDMLSIAGFDGYFKRLNPAFSEILGYTEAELMKKPSIELVHPDDRAATLAARDRLFAGEEITGLENRYRNKDGSWLWIEWRSVAVVEEGLVYAAARDITARKRAAEVLQKTNDELELHVIERTSELAAANELLRVENIEHQMTMDALRQAAEALQHAKEEADRANAAKSEFLSRMSHELRTPLNAILGFGQILERQILPPASKESVSYILKGGRHLLDLINEVLDIARVEAGHLELSLEPIALDDIVPEACALVRPLAAERSIWLDENISELGCDYVLADRQRLRQVLINLLSNAIKYNHEGGRVEVSCALEPEGWTSILVHDTGPGIAPENLAKLFAPFERLGASATEVEGTGLGLVLSQRLVSAMGGNLKVASTLGDGTTFTIELPRATSPARQLANLQKEKQHLKIPVEGERVYSVLCIEDNPSNLRLMEAIFEDRPEIMMLAAIQGSVGFDLARQHKPDLILLDLNLPDINGKEVLARLQQSDATKNIPVVIVSADATPKQVERLLAAGAKAYLAKPLDVEQFLSTLGRFLSDDNAKARKE